MYITKDNYHTFLSGYIDYYTIKHIDLYCWFLLYLYFPCC